MPFVMEYLTHPDSYWVIRYDAANRINKTGTLIFHGWHSMVEFDDEVAGVNLGAEIGLHVYNVNDPAIFDAYFGQADYPTLDAYMTILEQMALTLDDFFAAATQYSSVAYTSIEIGSDGDSRLNVTFNSEISGASLTAGVIISVDDVPVTISSASLDGTNKIIRYDLAVPLTPDQRVQWNYDDADGGVLLDSSGVPLHAFLNREGVNTIGGYWRFNQAGNSGQFLLVF